MSHLITKRYSGSLAPRAAVAGVIIAAIVFASFIRAVDAQRPSSPRLSEDQRILHVLNRLGFGARPGDVERVKTMGLKNYISQQLNPEKINDTAAQDRVKNLET